MASRTVWFALITLLFLTGTPSWATDDYAEATGQDCAVCHRDPAGGGPLTPTGEAYVAADRQWPIPEGAKGKALSPRTRALRLVLGFVHLVTAVVWLGTIFYVHLVLRPKYALGGLPKTEMRIAWGSIALLAATGVPLTRLRFHRAEALLETYSGNLLLVKIGLFVFLVVAAAVATLVISPRLRRLRAGWQTNDGRDGRPAWVKVGDVVYDVTGSSRWVQGNHFRRHQAGHDLTDALTGAPHGADKLEPFPTQAVPAGPGPETGAPVVRIFYAMAYLNLFVALGVLFILALWRWG